MAEGGVAEEEERAAKHVCLSRPVSPGRRERKTIALKERQVGITKASRLIVCR